MCLEMNDKKKRALCTAGAGNLGFAYQGVSGTVQKKTNKYLEKRLLSYY